MCWPSVQNVCFKNLLTLKRTVHDRLFTNATSVSFYCMSTKRTNCHCMLITTIKLPSGRCSTHHGNSDLQPCMVLLRKDESNIPYKSMNTNLYSRMSYLQMTLRLSIRVKVVRLHSFRIWFASNDFTDLESWLERGYVGVSVFLKNNRQ